MKKSNALMLSYMIFLVVALLAKITFKWEGLDQIAMGATVAGCFFAFADLSSWYASNTELILNALQKDQNVFVEYCKAQLDKINAWKTEAEEICKRMVPYCGCLVHAADLIEFCTKRKEKLENAHTELEKSINEGLTKMQTLLDKENLRISFFRIIDIILITIGFVVFFALITFDGLSTLLTNYQSYATIIAFVVIMLNYFCRDIIDEHTKNQADRILAKAEKEKNTVIELEEEIKKTPLLDRANQLIEQIEELDKLKEKQSNG